MLFSNSLKTSLPTNCSSLDRFSKKSPFAFKVLEESILNGSFEDWKYVANFIIKYKFLNKYREMN